MTVCVNMNSNVSATSRRTGPCWHLLTFSTPKTDCHIVHYALYVYILVSSLEMGIPTGNASTTHFFHFLKLKYQARVNLFEKDIESLHLHMRTCFTSMGLTRVSISIVHLGQCTFRPICFQLLSKA